MRKKVFLVFSSLSVAQRSQREDKKSRVFRVEGAGVAEGRLFPGGKRFVFDFSYLCVTQRSLREGKKNSFSRGGRKGR